MPGLFPCNLLFSELSRSLPFAQLRRFDLLLSSPGNVAFEGLKDDKVKV